MSNRIVAQEILDLARLAKCDPEDIRHFIAGASGVAGTAVVEFDVPADYCAVVVAVEDFNVDETGAHSSSQSQSGSLITEVQVAAWNVGGDVFYVFPPGLGRFTFTATPQGGFTYYARALGYFMPYKYMRVLSRMSTRIIG